MLLYAQTIRKHDNMDFFGTPTQFSHEEIVRPSFLRNNSHVLSLCEPKTKFSGVLTCKTETPIDVPEVVASSLAIVKDNAVILIKVETIKVQCVHPRR